MAFNNNLDLYSTTATAGNFGVDTNSHTNTLNSTSYIHALNLAAHPAHDANLYPFTPDAGNLNTYPNLHSNTLNQRAYLNYGADLHTATFASGNFGDYVNSSQMAADEAAIIQQIDALPPGAKVDALTIILPPLRSGERLDHAFIDWCLTRNFQI